MDDDLGLDKLTADQRYNILHQLLITIAAIDSPYMKSVAQQEIFDAAARNQEMYKAAEQAVNELRGQCVRELNQEVRQAVQAMVDSGELRLFTPAEEANLVRDADRAARQNLLDELQRQRDGVNKGNCCFQISYNRGKISVSVGDSFQQDSRAKPLSFQDMDQIAKHIYMLMHGG